MRELELVTATKIIQSNDLNYWEKSPLDTLGLFYSRFVSQQVAMTTTSTPTTPSLTSWSATTFGRPTTTTSPTTTTDFSSSRKMLTGTFEWTAVKNWMVNYSKRSSGASRVSPIFLCYRQTKILKDKIEKTRWSLIRTSIKCGSQVGMLRGIVINSRRIEKIWELRKRSALPKFDRDTANSFFCCKNEVELGPTLHLGRNRNKRKRNRRRFLDKNHLRFPGQEPRTEFKEKIVLGKNERRG